jgi:hypothetical protein
MVDEVRLISEGRNIFPKVDRMGEMVVAEDTLLFAVISKCGHYFI